MLKVDTTLYKKVDQRSGKGNCIRNAHFPKMILIAGDGRNVGKTFFASKLIRKFSRENNVIAIKTTPHIHTPTSDIEVLVQTGHYVVAREHGSPRKDTGLFLEAGAEEVYFIMAKQEYVEEAFAHIAPAVADHIVVVESGSLAECLKPGLFFFLKNHDEEIKKRQYLDHHPVIVTNVDGKFDFDIEKLKLQLGDPATAFVL